MKKSMTALILAAGVMAALVCAGCTQMPTEKHGISDMRPQIAFKADRVEAHTARVVVDGLDLGPVGDYIDGVASVRILPGTHTLRVVSGNEVLIDERFYVGDGVNRTFILK
jgi:hypothetical protein